MARQREPEYYFASEVLAQTRGASMISASRLCAVLSASVDLTGGPMLRLKRLAALFAVVVVVYVTADGSGGQEIGSPVQAGLQAHVQSRL